MCIYINQKGVKVVQVQKASDNKQSKNKTELIVVSCIQASKKANNLEKKSYCWLAQPQTEQELL